MSLMTFGRQTVKQPVSLVDRAWDWRSMRHLVELQGDSLHAESAGDGQGATFAARQVHNRSLEQGGLIPAIASTTYAGEYDQQQALKVGFRHVAKPVEPEELVRVITDLAKNC